MRVPWHTPLQICYWDYRTGAGRVLICKSARRCNALVYIHSPDMHIRWEQVLDVLEVAHLPGGVSS